MAEWETLGTVAPEELAGARLELHWAAQAAAAPGKLLLPPQPDYGQQSFTWDGRARALAQGAIAAPRPFRSALAFEPPALALIDADGADLVRLPLAGHTLDEAYEWLARALEALLDRPLPGPLERPGELPEHPVAEGACFVGMGPAFAEVGRYFADFDLLLSDLAMDAPGASPVRGWPHHYDLATVIPLDAPDGRAAGDPETARSIGVGMSPGDAARPAPYVYVTPWPPPADPDLPPLPAGGCWNTEGWLGAVLASPALVAAGDGPAQRAAAEEFVRAAVACCRRWLGA